MDVGLHFAPERAITGRLVEILDHHDARLRRGRDIVEVIHALLHIARAADRIAGANRHGLGEADHRRQIGKRTMQMLAPCSRAPRRSGATISTRLHTVGVSIDRRNANWLSVSHDPSSSSGNNPLNASATRSRRSPPMTICMATIIATQPPQPASPGNPPRNAPTLPPMIIRGAVKTDRRGASLLGGHRHIAGRDRLADHAAARAERQPGMMIATGGASSSSAPTIHTRDDAEHEAAGGRTARSPSRPTARARLPAR